LEAFLKNGSRITSSFVSFPQLLSSHVLAVHQAKACFRNALRQSSRHYNAWYGLGTIFFRTELYAKAELHVRAAVAINPSR
jgi:uncharacterized protein HemY